ncbi:MAG: DUF2892 domain-containing protein [Methylococcaceae bacterium]|nr:DUF2892 domain-containing protein [Methylococcaceae bacterium]
MTKNVGVKDKMARIGIGGLLILLTATGSIGPWGLIGLLPLITGLMGTCPAYTLLGIHTGDKSESAAG